MTAPKPHLAALAALAACVVALAPAAARAEAPAASTTCPPALLQAVGRHFGLARFRLPTDALGEMADTGGRLVAATCRPWTEARGQVVGAFVYDGGDADAMPLLVALVGQGGRQVLAAHRGALEINGATELSSDSLRLDTAAWPLAPGRPAVGLWLRRFRDRCQFDGGLDQVFTLYQLAGRNLQPVLALPTEHWRWGKGNRCLDDQVPRVSARVQVAMQPGQRDGQAELTLTASRSDGAPSLRAQLQHDGSGYDLTAWHQAFSRWFDR